jgi:hypothetical protein
VVVESNKDQGRRLVVFEVPARVLFDMLREGQEWHVQTLGAPHDAELKGVSHADGVVRFLAEHESFETVAQDKAIPVRRPTFYVERRITVTPHDIALLEMMQPPVKT